MENVAISNIEKAWLNLKNQPVNFSYWYPRINECQFKNPETAIIPLEFDFFKNIAVLTEEEIKSVENKYQTLFMSELKNQGFNTNRELFIRTGKFSGKYDFNECCYVRNADNLAKQFINICEQAFLIKADFASELVVREFVHSSNVLPTIYNGMPLRTEYRIFYDFDKKKIIDVFNYWGTSEMQKGIPAAIKNRVFYNTTLQQARNGFDEETLIQVEYEIDSDLETMYKYRHIIQKNCEDNAINLITNFHNRIQPNNLSGMWSIDFMMVDDEFYLIDMAPGHQSFYFEELPKKVRKKYKK